MGRNGRRLRLEPTDEWEQIELLCGWPEQRAYELIRPLVLFGGPASERAGATGAASERTLQRRVVRFEAEGMESSWRDHGVGKWLAYERSTGALVGQGGPSWAVVEGVGCVEIGWAFRQELWGRRGTPPRSGPSASTTSSRSLASRRSSPSPRSTTPARGRSWSAWGCATSARYCDRG
jgi:hypothetical protein